MNELTMRQTQVLGFIETFTATEGYPPTRNDIAKAFKFRSCNAAEEHLRALERKGCIEISPGVARGIKVVRQPWVNLVLARWKSGLKRVSG